MNGLLKTYLFIAGLTALFGGVGFIIGGQGGMMAALLFAAGMNFLAYWNSDKMVLSMYGAKKVDHTIEPAFYAITKELSDNAGLPMPKLYIMQNPQPNAFATGRNPDNAAVAITTGLMDMLEPDEIRGVIAHELAHIKNRDTLIMTLTATIAGAISMLANFGMFFGGRDENSRMGVVGMIAIMLLAPFAAMLVQMAISRTREYSADRTGAEISGDPKALASALQKIENYAKRIHNPEAERSPASAHLFIINPLHQHKVDNLFSTHPNTQNRIQALLEMPVTSGQRTPWQAPQAQSSGPWG